MQLDFYKALIEIKIDPDTATQLVKSMNAHIDSQISAAVTPLATKMDSMQAALAAKIDAIGQVKKEKQEDADRASQRMRWVFVTAVTTASAVLAGLKAFGVI